MKKICVITGASSGIGKEFFMELRHANHSFDFEEFYVIARNEERLSELKKYTDLPIKVIPMDLSEESSYDKYEEILKSDNVEISLLVNCSGFGKFDSTVKVGRKTNLNMIDLNVKATVAIDLISLEHMKSGDGIINIASVAAYQPIPYINTYGATKAFVLNFTRALSREIRHKGIHVMAVCPFWTKTEFFDRAVKPCENEVVKKYIAMYEPRQIVKRALSDYKKKKEVSLFGFKTKLQLAMVKITPASMVMSIWTAQQKLKNRD